jgi:hypothetical protein
MRVLTIVGEFTIDLYIPLLSSFPLMIYANWQSADDSITLRNSPNMNSLAMIYDQDPNFCSIKTAVALVRMSQKDDKLFLLLTLVYI